MFCYNHCLESVTRSNRILLRYVLPPALVSLTDNTSFLNTFPRQSKEPTCRSVYKMDQDFLDCFGKKKIWAYIPKKHLAAYPYSARKRRQNFVFARSKNVLSCYIILRIPVLPIRSGNWDYLGIIIHISP